MINYIKKVDKADLNIIFIATIVLLSISAVSKLNLFISIFTVIMFLLLIYIFPKVSIAFLILINESFLYLINLNGVDIRNPLLLIIIFLFLINLNKFIYYKKEYKFKNIILLIIFLSLIEVLNSLIINDEPIIYGFTANKIFFGYLLYFYLLTLIKKNNTIKNYIEKFIMCTGTVLAFLFIIQYLIYSRKIIFYVQYGYRNGVRWYTGFGLIIFSMFILIGKMLKIKDIKRNSLNLLAITIDLISIIVVSQTRNFIVGIFISFVILVVLQKKYNKTLLFFMIFTVISLYILMYKNNFIINLFNSIYNEGINNKGTVGFRFKEIQFFVGQWIKNPLLGNGLYSDNFSKSYIITGLSNKYYTSDVGIIGLIYQFGVIGICIFGYLLIKVLNVINILYKKSPENCYTYIGYFSYIVATSCSSLAFNEMNSIFYFVIFLVFLESENYKCNRPKITGSI
ncbi:MAG: O-antigen ligase family protein [Clostridium sp.]|nr:O-antigen ligase family protein [Clostridium sp.]